MSEKDTTSLLTKGTAGSEVDESDILVGSFASGAAPASVGRRPRVVIGGEDGRTVLVPTHGKKYLAAVGVVDLELREQLRAMLDGRKRRLELLETVIYRMVGQT